jgi:hypothetical protein
VRAALNGDGRDDDGEVEVEGGEGGALLVRRMLWVMMMVITRIFPRAGHVGEKWEERNLLLDGRRDAI